MLEIYPKDGDIKQDSDERSGLMGVVVEEMRLRVHGAKFRCTPLWSCTLCFGTHKKATAVLRGTSNRCVSSGFAVAACSASNKIS